MQLSFSCILEKVAKKQETKVGQHELAQIIASLLTYSTELEQQAHSFKGADSAQKRLTQFTIAQEIRKRISI